MYTRASTRQDDYDALVHGHYGFTRPRQGGSHGASHVENGGAAVSATASRSVTLTADTGEQVLEAVPPVVPEVEEYVVDRPEPPATAVMPPPPGPVETPPAPESSEAPASSWAPSSAPSLAPEPTPAPPPTPAPTPTPSLAPAQDPPPAVSPPARHTPVDQPSGSGLEDDQLAKDMEAILSGRKVYDPEKGQVLDRGPTGAPPAKPAPDAKARNQIFDQIAASLEHSNAFDLGTVELQRRFDTFDRLDDRRRTNPAGAAAQSSAQSSAQASAQSRVPATAHGATAPLTRAPVTEVPARPGTGEFVRDLDRIVQSDGPGLSTEDYARAYEPGPWSSLAHWSAACGPSGLALSVAPQRSTAMFDTGEHVLAAGDLFVDQLRLGPNREVAFSYGQVISMGDFYADVDQMLTADPAELRRLKALIARSTEYYRGNRRDKSLDVGHAEWEGAIGRRYLDLAERNYDHFAPAGLLGLGGAGRESDNKRRWEELHGRALAEVGQLVLAHPDSTPFKEEPLITNAFADHFLTDAFAAGHLINKEMVIERFRSRFFSGSSLNDAGRAFFEQVADRAYTGEVKRRFSQLEPSSPPICAFGWCVPLHPNIRTAGMFAEVLKQAAVAEPVKIANLAVKIIHDELGTTGVEVVNDAGDGPWTLTGDTALNPATLAVMRRAVQQSVDNLDDPSVLATNPNLTGLFAKVWRLTPKPTPAGRAAVVRTVETYTDPGNQTMVTKTVDLINHQLDQLVQALLDSGQMRRD